MYKGHISDIAGIRVGHAQDDAAKTGVTVLLPPQGNTCAVEVRGGSPGTREIALLAPENAVSEVHALILSGGSAYGLASSVGVMESLERDGIGLDVSVGIVPIVCQAVLFDLAYGSSTLRPDREMGALAYRNARIDDTRQGNVGAGAGATVGQILGPDCRMKGGLGSATLQAGELKVSALVAVNAMGDIFDAERNIQIAGPMVEGKMQNTLEVLMKQGGKPPLPIGENTTIGIVATNGTFDKTQLKKIASMTHNGYARSINPVHTMFDGDTIFALATNEVEADINVAGTLAAQVMSRAIANAIESAQ